MTIKRVLDIRQLFITWRLYAHATQQTLRAAEVKLFEADEGMGDISKGRVHFCIYEN